ncbi:transglutaminase domain-containing protein [Limibacter armeniacum]|uniref:transglutaminase domain-containing protein n=1 Tax=Limibacter armeniacum TaxID=466084 RepID=UPI002FE57D17
MNTPNLMHLRMLVYVVLLYFISIPFSYSSSPSPKFIDLYTYDYSKVDQEVSKLNGKEFPNVQALAEELLSPYKTPHERLRAAWVWVTHNITYDTDIYNIPGYYSPSAPEVVLKAKKGVCTGYSHLLKAIMQVTDPGMVKVIAGLGRVNYNVTDGHAWNLVTVNGYSYLLDPTWAAGYIKDIKNGESNHTVFVQKYDEFWYLTPPAYFATTHYTQDLKAQLLPHPLSLDNFKEMPFVRPNYFKHMFSSYQLRFTKRPTSIDDYQTMIIGYGSKQYKIYEPLAKETASYHVQHLASQGGQLHVTKGQTFTLVFYSEKYLDNIKVNGKKQKFTVEQRPRGYKYLVRYTLQDDSQETLTIGSGKYGYWVYEIKNDL